MHFIEPLPHFQRTIGCLDDQGGADNPARSIDAVADPLNGKRLWVG
jgi:hypothetical protein